MVIAVALLATACSGVPAAKGGGTTRGTAGAPKVTVTPANGATGVKPDARIEVTADDGTLSQIAVRSKGKTVAGALSADRRTWQATWTLAPGASYSVAATATGTSGRTTSVATTFSTQLVHSGLSVSTMTPSRGTTVGVGMPVTVTFNRPVRDKAAVERALEIKTDCEDQGVPPRAAA